MAKRKKKVVIDRGCDIFNTMDTWSRNYGKSRSKCSRNELNCASDCGTSAQWIETREKEKKLWARAGEWDRLKDTQTHTEMQLPGGVCQIELAKRRENDGDHRRKQVLMSMRQLMTLGSSEASVNRDVRAGRGEKWN